jgi:two-component system chemotaxis response regulator CheB
MTDSSERTRYHDIVVVGTSAGGVEALSQLTAGLPGDLPAAVFVVLHIPPNSASALPAILHRRGLLPAAHAVHGEPVRHGRIYVAPPDHHLLLRPDGVHLTRGPRENGHRPAVDVLFRSAAAAFGSRVVGVVLTGALDDGTAGLAAIKRHGGVALVQEPSEALAPSMPVSAIAHVAVDRVLSVSELGTALVDLAKEPAPVDGGAGPDDLQIEVDMGELELDAMQRHERPGDPSGFSCPDCGGGLFELRDGELVRFRCRVGHAWSGHSLLGQQAETLESALWIALRSLEERAALSRRLLAGAVDRGHPMSAQRFEEQAGHAQRAAERIREFLLGQVNPRESASEAGGHVEPVRVSGESEA